MSEEFAHHIELRAADLIRQGHSPTEAIRRARVEFGSVDSLREQGRESRGLRAADELRGDARFALRMLMRTRGFAVVAVLTLGLGIGATAAIFSVLDAVLLRPLPFASPERLVVLDHVDLPRSYGRSTPPQSRPELQDAVSLSAFADIAAYGHGALNLSSAGPPRRVSVGVVTADFFSTVGVQPVRGRDFVAEEGAPAGPLAAIVSDAFWRRHLGSATNLALHDLTLNGRRYQVVGVMPRGFAFPGGAEIWIPLTVPLTTASFEPFRQYLPIALIARLSPGTPLGEAQAQLRSLQAEWLPPERLSEMPAAELVRPLHGVLVGDRRTVLLVLLGATALVLLVACANVANLLLSRNSARRREMAVRTALGATPARLLRQMLVESMLLAVIGSVAGIGFALIGMQLLDALVPSALAGAATLRIDARVLGFTAAMTLTTGLAFGVLPALAARKTDAGDVLKQGLAAAAGGRSPRVRQVLVAAEIALSVILLVGSALMLRSLHTLLTTESGVNPARVATLELTLAPEEYPNNAARRDFFERVLQRLDAAPEIEAAAAVNELPLRGEWPALMPLFPEGPRPQTIGMRYMVQDLYVSPDYFQALGVPIVLGRAPRARRDTLAVHEVAINEELANLHWPGENPIGQRLERMAGGKLEVVGVVANVLPHSLEFGLVSQAYYALHEYSPPHAAIVVRGHVPARTLTRVLEQTLRDVAPAQAVYNVRTMEQVIAGAIATRRTNTWLITSFGVLALALAVVGVYGVMAFNVARRTREFGIRMALGAPASRIRLAVLREAGLIGLSGIAIGLAGAWMLSRFLESMIYGISVRDPAAFTLAPLVLLIVAVIAALVPAQRATRIDPVAAMRVE
jgi:putative ABC transport system permease protein